MKRVVISVVLLIVAVVFSVISYFTVNSRVNRIIELMKTDREITMSTSSPDKERTNKITEEWDKNETYLVSMLTHHELEEVEIGIMCLTDYMNQGYTEEYIKTLNECINRLNHIKETEKADTKNIF